MLDYSLENLTGRVFYKFTTCSLLQKHCFLQQRALSPDSEILQHEVQRDMTSL